MEKVTTPGIELTDDRGWIKNLVLAKSWEAAQPGSIGGVELIYSRKGAVRANHKHREDWHYLYIERGSILYEEQKGEDWAGQVVPAGSMVYTQPGVFHRVTALDDTTMVSVSHLPRDHETHEKDVVRL